MERVTGIGGVFFSARDPESLTDWYEQNLGVTRPPPDYETAPWQQEGGSTVFAAFAEDSPLFGASGKGWSINFRVHDLDAVVDQLRGNGIEVDLDPERYPNGRFASLSDPEGNGIQLWEPGGVDAPS